jgi:hypothetical protein
MDAIDKTTQAFIDATDAMVEQEITDMVDPSINASIKPENKRKRDSEVVAYLKQRTLAAIERLDHIATDQLYTRDKDGKRQRVTVPVGVQLQACIAFLDRAMGKPQVNVDLTSGDRPIMFDASFAHKPLVQASLDPLLQEANVNTGPLEHGN